MGVMGGVLIYCSTADSPVVDGSIFDRRKRPSVPRCASLFRPPRKPKTTEGIL